MKKNETRAGDHDDAGLRDAALRFGLDYLETIPDTYLDASLIERIPVEWARTNAVLPIRIDEEICLLTSDPANIRAQEYLLLLLGDSLRPVVASKSAIMSAVEKCYFSRSHTPDRFIEGMEVNGDTVGGASRSDDLLQSAEKTPVTQLVNLILLEAVKKRASDIHFEPFESSLKVRYRVDGILYTQTSPPKQLEEALVSRLKVMAKMDIAEKRLPQDGMARVRVGEREIDIRVSTVPVAEGERMVLRLLDRDSSLLPLEALGMSQAALKRFAGVLDDNNGMIAVCGPTGAGKTTTLYAALQKLDSARRNIITIEDPIEYQLPDIGQIQVKPKIGLTFANGLRHILRQDPDVVLVGETRDIETAEIAVRASLTGHLVFTTLHTNDAAGAVVRLVDMGLEPYLIASCLRAVLAQRLVRNLCTKCRRKGVFNPEHLASAGKFASRLANVDAYDPAGCPECLDGFRGRSGLFELLIVTEPMRGLIRAGGNSLSEIQTSAVEGGMVSLLEDGIEKVSRGITSLREVISVTA